MFNSIPFDVDFGELICYQISFIKLYPELGSMIRIFFFDFSSLDWSQSNEHSIEFFVKLIHER